jgi:hypothetical protein
MIDKYSCISWPKNLTKGLPHDVRTLERNIYNCVRNSKEGILPRKQRATRIPIDEFVIVPILCAKIFPRPAGRLSKTVQHRMKQREQRSCDLFISPRASMTIPVNHLFTTDNTEYCIKHGGDLGGLLTCGAVVLCLRSTCWSMLSRILVHKEIVAFAYYLSNLFSLIRYSTFLSFWLLYLFQAFFLTFNLNIWNWRRNNTKSNKLS